MKTNAKIKLNMDALKTNKEWVRHKVKQGTNIFRILPPFGEESNGYPYRKWQIIWGLQDPKSGRMRPFASSLMTERRDPVVEFLDDLRERLSAMEMELKSRGLDDKAVTRHTKYKRLAKFIQDFSPKTSYVYNAVDKSGVVGLLELKTTAHKDMKMEMNKYIQDYNQDPTSLNSDEDDSGVWFNVKREGEGFSTKYSVEKVQIKGKLPTGQITFMDDRSPLPEVLVENFEHLAYDLNSIYKLNTYDEMSEILAANLDRIYELCPEANLSVKVNLDSEEDDEVPSFKSPSVAGPTVAQKAQGRVALRLDDEDEDDDFLNVKGRQTTRAATFQLSDDDDFMAEADAILNG